MNSEDQRKYEPFRIELVYLCEEVVRTSPQGGELSDNEWSDFPDTSEEN